MALAVTDVYEELYHYTTVAGLEGIVRSQSLWATNFAYVNDSQEFKGYFQNRLPGILNECVGPALTKAFNTNATAKTNLEEMGGLEIATEHITKELQEAITTAIQTVYEPYLISFCGAIKDSGDDGLLSQWRGYGIDGGYAIVFDTKGLDALLLREEEAYHFAHLQWGDTDYHDHRKNSKSSHAEMLQYETDLQEGLTTFLLSSDPKDLESMLVPLMGMSCMHKHIGFREEAEVRVVVIPLSEENIQIIESAGGIKKKRKDYEMRMKNGTLVPYVALGGDSSLPIKKVIVGPHPDKEKRKKSVEMLLVKYNVKADVIVSDIPYIG